MDSRTTERPTTAPDPKPGKFKDQVSNAVIGAVVTAVVGAVATGMFGGDDTGEDGATAPTSTATAPPGAAPSTAAPPSTVPPAAVATAVAPVAPTDVWVPQWGPDVIDLGRLDLDAVPPMVSSSGQVADVVAYWFTSDGRVELHHGGSSHLSAWTGPGVPTPADCHHLVTTQPMQEAPVGVGDRVCVWTDTGHVALLELTTVEGRTGDSRVLANMTVWREG